MVSLSELLVSLFLSTFLGCLLFHQYASLTQNHQFQMIIFNQQFEQNLLAKLLRKSIHQAGFLPCGSQSKFEVWDASQAIWVKKKALITKSNTIIANYMDENFKCFQGDHSDNLVIPNRVGFRKNHAVLLTNCHYNELNRIKSIKPYGKNFKIDLVYPSKFVVDNDSYVGKWHQIQFKFQQGQILLGDTKNERLTDKITKFETTSLKPNLIQISWAFKYLPPFNMTIWAPNVLS